MVLFELWPNPDVHGHVWYVVIYACIFLNKSDIFSWAFVCVQFASSMYTNGVQKTSPIIVASTQKTWQRSYKNLAFLATSLVQRRKAKRQDVHCCYYLHQCYQLISRWNVLVVDKRGRSSVCFLWLASCHTKFALETHQDRRGIWLTRVPWKMAGKLVCVCNHACMHGLSVDFCIFSETWPVRKENEVAL